MRFFGLTLGVCALLGLAMLSGGDVLHHVRSLTELFDSNESIISASKRLIFVGDIMLARDVERKIDLYGADYPFSFMSMLRTAETVVGNFEASVPEVHARTQDFEMNFSVRENILPSVASAGFTHVSLANNHADDFGYAGYEHTVQSLFKKKLIPFGSPFTLDEDVSVSYETLGTETVALIGVYAIDSVPQREDVEALFKTVSLKSDIQIVYVHWGVEYELVHNTTQEHIAHMFVDAGADLVVGHHPHVVQDIERYGDALIFYSLGNFIFDQYFSTDVQQGLLLEVVLHNGTRTILLHPFSTEKSRTAPQLLEGEERERFLEILGKRGANGLIVEVASGKLTW